MSENNPTNSLIARRAARLSPVFLALILLCVACGGGPIEPVPDASADADLQDAVQELCSNGVHDGDETDLDCGGSCEPCLLDQYCRADEDCEATTECHRPDEVTARRDRLDRECVGVPTTCEECSLDRVCTDDGETVLCVRPRELNEECADETDLCAPGLFCQFTRSGRNPLWTCQTYREEGESCDTGYESDVGRDRCNRGLFCNETDICETKRPVGSVCMRTEECVEGIVCVRQYYNSRPGVCATGGVAGDECDGTHGWSRGFDCSPSGERDWTCQQQLDENDECGFGVSCTWPLACIPDVAAGCSYSHDCSSGEQCCFDGTDGVCVTGDDTCEPLPLHCGEGRRTIIRSAEN